MCWKEKTKQKRFVFNLWVPSQPPSLSFLWQPNFLKELFTFTFATFSPRDPLPTCLFLNSWQSHPPNGSPLYAPWKGLSLQGHQGSCDSRWNSSILTGFARLLVLILLTVTSPLTPLFLVFTALAIPSRSHLRLLFLILILLPPLPPLPLHSGQSHQYPELPDSLDCFPQLLPCMSHWIPSQKKFQSPPKFTCAKLSPSYSPFKPTLHLCLLSLQ